MALVLVQWAGCSSSTSDSFDFIEGTWTTVKDGLSLTLEVTRDPNTGGWLERQRVDDGNSTMSTKSIVYDPAAKEWTQTLFLDGGITSRFVGGVEEDGRVVLEQVSYADRLFDPPQSRVVYIPQDSNRFVIDWQSRAEDGSWVPRPVPFEHIRVNRPRAPANEGRIAFISNREENWEVYTMNPDGSDGEILRTMKPVIISLGGLLGGHGLPFDPSVGVKMGGGIAGRSILMVQMQPLFTGTAQ